MASTLSRPIAARNSPIARSGPSPRGEAMRPPATASVLACSDRNGEFSMGDRKTDQLVPDGERRFVHSGSHDARHPRPAGDAGARQPGIAEAHHDILDRDAEHFGRGLRDDRVAALSHVDACCSRPRPCRPPGHAPALRRPCGGRDRCRRPCPSRSARCRRASIAARDCASTSRRRPRRRQRLRAAAASTMASWRADPPPHS